MVVLLEKIGKYENSYQKAYIFTSNERAVGFKNWLIKKRISDLENLVNKGNRENYYDLLDIVYYWRLSIEPYPVDSGISIPDMNTDVSDRILFLIERNGVKGKKILCNSIVSNSRYFALGNIVMNNDLGGYHISTVVE